MKYESPMCVIQKLWPRLKFFGQVKYRSNLHSEGHKVKILVPMERSYHKEYTCEI